MLQPPQHMPTPATRRRRFGPDLIHLHVGLVTCTPVLGGSVAPRTIDDVDLVRVPSVRGHLRFWWRALCGHAFPDPAALYAAEARLWGGVGGEAPTPSAVLVTIRDVQDANVDAGDVGWQTPGAYALWPARATPTEPLAPRRVPGLSFELEIRCPRDDESAVRATVRAWIAFGGYGGRTRRGCGSLTVRDDREAWLADAASGDAMRRLLGNDAFGDPGPPSDTPLLKGAVARAGSATGSAMTAWATALRWLQDFRQGQPGHGALGTHSPAFARVRGDSRRPGRSNWPEADKVRNLSGPGPWAHPSRHPGGPVWPRAGFGLPIVARFQQHDRPAPGQAGTGPRCAKPEPPAFELRWFDREGTQHDRLASPLIVKPLPLRHGTFVPAAIWLARRYPEAGRVGIRRDDARHANSLAAFDTLVAPGDLPQFTPLATPGGGGLQAAFLHWLDGAHPTTGRIP